MNWKEYGDLAYYACTVAAAVFVVLYLLIAPWYKTATGRNIMAVMASMAGILVYFTWAIWHGSPLPFGFYPMRAVLFTALGLSLVWRVIILVRAQLAARRVGKEESHEIQ